jgi:cbb3-type cytochrome oxidase cytochrome c subunit
LTSEMDALVAYLQTLGTFVDFKDYNPDMDDKK